MICMIKKTSQDYVSQKGSKRVLGKNNGGGGYGGGVLFLFCFSDNVKCIIFIANIFNVLGQTAMTKGVLMYY